jgi:hypothetical protein
MDFSRLNVTALDNNKNNKENIVIVFVGFKPTYFLFNFSLYIKLLKKNRKKNNKFKGFILLEKEINKLRSRKAMDKDKALCKALVIALNASRERNSNSHS